MKNSSYLRRLLLLATLLFTIALVGFGCYNTPSFSHQGRLLDNNGNSVANGNYNVVYNLYHSSTGGTLVYSQTSTIAVNDGYFTSSFGITDDVDPKIFTEITYLEMEINGETLAPRQRLLGSPYAANLVAGAAVVGSQPITYTYGTVNNLGSALLVANTDDSATGGSGLTAVTDAQPNPPGSVDVAAVRGLARDADSSTGSGVYGGIFVSEDYRGLYADGGGTYYAAYFEGNIAVTGTCAGCRTTLVAQNDGSSTIEPGDFVTAVGVVVDSDYDMPIMLVRKATNGDTIVGVANSAMERGDYREGALTQFGFNLVDGISQPKEYVSVIMDGLVQARVSSSNNTARVDSDYITLETKGTNIVDNVGNDVAQIMSETDDSGLQWILLK